MRQISNSVRRTGDRRRNFLALNGAGIGVSISIDSALAGPFAQKTETCISLDSAHTVLAPPFDMRPGSARFMFHGVQHENFLEVVVLTAQTKTRGTSLIQQH